MSRATTTERSRAMKRTNNGILIPDVPIMAGGTLPNAVKGVSAGGKDWKKHAVDMGLPSGTLWADCDIDVNMPDGFCVTAFINEKSFFSWGNIQGYNPVGGGWEYGWTENNYMLTKGYELQGDIPYNVQNDAALANLKKPWKTPSYMDFKELIQNIEFLDSEGHIIEGSNKITTINNTAGIRIRSIINQNELFFAASGYGNNNAWYDRGAIAHYLTVNRANANDAYSFFANNSNISPDVPIRKYVGLPIRPIIQFND